MPGHKLTINSKELVALGERERWLLQEGVVEMFVG